MKDAPALLALIMLAACGGNSDVPTAEENRQLEEAANLLNEAPANLEAIDDSAVANAPPPEELP